MNTSESIKGAILVGLGATSYGMLATFVKLAYGDVGSAGTAYTPAEVISAQFILGIIGVFLIGKWQNRNVQPEQQITPSRKDITQLMVAGTSMGLTSIFYYLAVKYIPVSVGIVLLMQTVWMGVALEAIIAKKAPSGKKILSVAIVLIGTFLATNLIGSTQNLDWRGIVLGLCAAASFTTTMYTANRIATHLPASKRSLFMLLGGGVIVAIFAISTQTTPINWDIFYRWGLIIALFGTIIPPLLLNAGFPKIDIGLGSIISSLELPVSVCMAYVLLNEHVSTLQWTGIGLILLAIVLMNTKSKAA